LCIGLLLSQGCYQNNIDCTDPFAVNFNPLADENCDDCCENPKVKLIFRHLRDSLLYRSSDTFKNKFNQLYKLEDIQYYISGFRMINSNGVAVKPEDEITYVTDQGQRISYPDDHIIIRTNAVDYSMYGIRTSGEFSAVGFRVGWDPILANASKLNVSESHPLSEKLRLKDNLGKAVGLSLKLIRGEQFKDTTQIFIEASNGPETLDYELPFKIRTGISPVFTITASYEKWFFDTDLSGSEQAIKSQFLGNIGKVFSVK
jgi:hypothetical protein